jgi:hypothetical protein
MVCVEILVMAGVFPIETVGATVSTVTTSGALVPVLPAGSVSFAVRTLTPSCSRTVPVLQVWSPCSVADPTATPSSYSVTMVPVARPKKAEETKPVNVCAFWVVSPPAPSMVTTGAWASSTNAIETAPVLP